MHSSDGVSGRVRTLDALSFISGRGGTARGVPALYPVPSTVISESEELSSSNERGSEAGPSSGCPGHSSGSRPMAPTLSYGSFPGALDWMPSFTVLLSWSPSPTVYVVSGQGSEVAGALLTVSSSSSSSGCILSPSASSTKSSWISESIVSSSGRGAG